MKIGIICSEAGGGWVYANFIDMFKKYSKHQILVNSSEPCDVYYYMPYYEAPTNPKRPCVAWFSHQEVRKDLFNKYISVAKSVDVAITHSRKHKDLLINTYGISDVVQIMPGVNLDAFKIYPKPEHSGKLVAGFVGRQYQSSNRKNPGMLQKISKLSYVDLRITNNKIKAESIPEFYSKLDLVVSPSLLEAGPMSHIESLACGIPFICYDGVGTAQEIDYGTIRVPFNNENEFLKRLLDFYNNKEYLEYNKPENRKRMRRQVEGFSWENFVNLHDKVFENILGIVI